MRKPGQDRVLAQVFVGVGDRSGRIPAIVRRETLKSQARAAWLGLGRRVAAPARQSVIVLIH
jgi:hypothetical protein